MEISANDDTATATVKLQIIKIDLSVQASLNPTTVALGSGQEVTLTFNMNKVATLTIDAQRLTGASSKTGTVALNDEGTISYTPDAIGTQTITFKTADAVRGGTVTISHEEITSIKLPYGRSSWSNKTVAASNAPNKSIEGMQIKLSDETNIGSCDYFYESEWTLFEGRKYTRELRKISFNNYNGTLTNDTAITITDGTKTISTTIGKLISGSNLSFSN